MMLAIESSGPNKLVDSKLFDELLRNFHSLKGLSAMVGMEEATQLSHHIEDYLKELKQQSAVISSESIAAIWRKSPNASMTGDSPANSGA